MASVLDAPRISALLAPFLGDANTPPQLIPELQTYLDLLLRWNSRINLTAIRDPEQIVVRHFGESLLAARVLLESGTVGVVDQSTTLADLGSGPGFPGIPIKLMVPQTQLTLIESSHKKATFLRESVRALSLSEAEVYCGRAESWGKHAQVVTMRAVEDFEVVLHTASKIIAPGGDLCLLISKEQVHMARLVLERRFLEQRIIDIPLSAQRVIYLTKDATLGRT